MNEVGRTAIRIGEELESVHQQRQRAQAAYDLVVAVTALADTVYEEIMLVNIDLHA